MAIVKYGAVVTGIKGSVGGTTFQGGRSGGIMKNKGAQLGQGQKRKTPPSVKGVVIAMRNFGTVTKAWASLSVGERVSWEGLIGVWTFTDKFGDVYNGTAYQIFTAANINRLTMLLPILTTAPVKVDAVDPVINMSDYSLSGTWDLNRTVAPAETQYITAYFSFAQNETKNVGSITFRLGGSVSYPGTGTDNARVFYLATYGIDPPLGSYVYIRFWQCVPAYPKQQFLQVIKSLVVA